MHRLIPLVLILLAGLGTTSTSRAQSTGAIEGTITHAETSLPIEGVNIIIAGTSQGAASNLNGFYQIDLLTPGTYTLIARAVGFEPSEKSILIQR